MAEERYHLLVNSHSGAASKLGRDKLEDFIIESGLQVETFDFLPPDEFGVRLKALVDSPYPVIIGGGDGSIAKCAEPHIKKDKPFAVLPLGTMNFLAQDIGMPLDAREGLSALRRTRTVAVDVGTVNDRAFLCAASWGAMPESGKFREENRSLPNIVLIPRLTMHILRQIDLTERRLVKATIDGRTRWVKTGMLIVSNNLFNASLFDPMRRTSLQGGVLGVYTVSPHGLYEKLRLLFHLKRGGWDPSIREHLAHDVVLETRKPTELISVDGEPIEMQSPFRFKIRRKALKILVPDRGAGDS